ncbi:hypothetical protein CVT24_006434 [Panaeolus cyanescens]|uniref:Uncharacterized protein n=1 Tax=Panaeolus cyanescens TaxID=181874 RepID=A0A409VZ99_9AGAR|nr:hypothetical protein CVT24_006434 [Panaeolus cyanescens]
MSKFLLAHRDPNAILTPYDGRVGALIGNYIYTTPNETFIPLPLYGDREVYVRQDYRYGPDDHTLWPQIYTPLAPHLAAIPRKPVDPKHPLTPLWLNPKPSDFIPTSPGETSPSSLGKINPDFIAKIRPVSTLLNTRYNAYVNSLALGELPNSFASSLHRISGYVIGRLTSLPMTWSQIRFTVTELQRLLLELHGCLDYIETYKPQLDGLLPMPANPPTLPTIGAFTTNIRVVEEFAGIGIPIWLIRQKDGSSFANNVLEEVQPVHYKDRLVLDRHPDFPTVFEGDYDTDPFTVVSHILQFSREWPPVPNPFKVESKPSPLPSTTKSEQPLPRKQAEPPQSTSQYSSRAPENRPPAKKMKHANTGPNMASTSANHGAGRDKFLPLQGPLAPFSIPVWAVKLHGVSRNPPSTGEPLKMDSLYAFPDPGVFVSVQKDDRRQYIIEQYCRIASLWRSHIRQGSTKGLSTQHWRDLLFVDFRLPPSQWVTGETATGARRREALMALVPTASLHKYINRDERYTLLETGESFASGSMPSDASIRKFCYHLYMLNFRAELTALDRAARIDDSKQAEQEQDQEIARLFPPNTFNLPISGPNAGLAADSFRDRVPYLRTLARIMSRWKGEKPHIFNFELEMHSKEPNEDIPHYRASNLEHEVAKFYCQQFFNYFRRAAQIPHRHSPVAAGTV